MTKESAVLQVGMKGMDIVMSMLKKGNTLKNQFVKPVKAGVSYYTKSGGAAEDLAKKQEAEREQSRLGHTAKTVGEGLKTIGQGMASLNPVGLMQGISQASANAIASITPIGGDAIKAVGEAMGMVVQIGAGSMTAIKNAQASAIDTLEKEGRRAFFGGEKIFGKGGVNTNLSLAEQSMVLDSVTNKFGKVGDKFGRSIQRLLDAGKDVNQVSAVASGNLGALGTNEGYFLNKITSQFANLPPEMGQELMSQITDSLSLDKLQNDMAVKNRKINKDFDESERAKQKTIANMAGSAVGLNDTINQLEIDLVQAGTILQSSVKRFGDSIDSVAKRLPTIIDNVESGAKKVASGASFIWNAVTGQHMKNVSKDKQ